MNQNCRICGNSGLAQILDLGFSPPSNALLEREDLEKAEVHFPLVLLFCETCKLVQTKDFHTKERLFTSSYPYLSSTSSEWVKHAHDLVDRVIDELCLNHESFVIEIASNDGYLLDRLTQRGIRNCGIEPTKLAADISTAKGHRVYECFLTIETARLIRKEQGPADLVIANNVFAHVPELREFTEAAKILLSDEGILIIEVQYFGELFEKNYFDTVYHEHYSYFTIASLTHLLNGSGLAVTNIDHLGTHGGSIRVIAKKVLGDVVNSNALRPFHSFEEITSQLDVLMSFQKKVDLAKMRIRSFFSNQWNIGNSVAGLGAAAKGNTLINFVGLDTQDFRYVLDSAKSKQGKFLPGSHIPIFPLEFEYLKQIDTLIILPWNLSSEFSDIVKSVRNDDEFSLYTLLPDIKKLD